MTITWFNACEAEKFGKSLALFFIQRIPLSTIKVKNKALAKQIETVDMMYLQIEQFKLNNKLNIYKKAKLGSSFKFELIAAGFEPEFVDEVTKGLMYKL